MSNDLIADLSLNPNSISAFTGVNISEGMARNLVNNAARQFASMVKASFAANAGTITSASTLTLASISTGDYILLTPSGGSSSISSFGTATEGLSKHLEALGTVILRNDSSKLNLPSATDLTISTGDVIYARAMGSTAWKVVPLNMPLGDGAVTTDRLADGAVTAAKLAESAFISLSTATLTTLDYVPFADVSDSNNKKKGLLGDVVKIVNRYYDDYTANSDISTALPADDSVPLVSEGVEILSVSVTTTTATQRVRLTFIGQVSYVTTVIPICAAAFRDTTCIDATAIRFVGDTSANNGLSMISLQVEEVPGSASTFTYSVRVGPGTTGTIRMNGTAAGRYFGGASRATLVVEVIEP